MKYYSIEVILHDNGTKKFYGYTCEFLSTRIEISEDCFEKNIKLFTNMHASSFSTSYF